MAFPAKLVLAALAGVAAEAAALTASDLPALRAGLWEETNTFDDKTRSAQLCDAGGSFGAVMMRELGPHCPPPVITRTPTKGWVVEFSCPNPNGRTEGKMTFEGDFKTAYVVELDATSFHNDGPPEHHHVHSEGRYLGPCPNLPPSSPAPS